MTPKLGDVLIELGFITPDELAAGLERQRQDQRRLGEVLVEMGIIAEDKLAKALRRQTGAEEWDPRLSPVHERVIAMFPAELAIRHRVFPVAIRKNSIGVTWCVATTDPTDEATRNALGKSLCTPEEPVVVNLFISAPSNIEAAIATHYGDSAPARTAEELDILIEEPVDPPEQPRALLASIRLARKSLVPADPEGESN